MTSLEQYAQEFRQYKAMLDEANEGIERIKAALKKKTRKKTPLELGDNLEARWIHQPAKEYTVKTKATWGFTIKEKRKLTAEEDFNKTIAEVAGE